MQPFDIFTAEFLWKGCNDMRPWLVVEHAPTGGINCFPISGQDYGQHAFRLDQSDPDFSATGLILQRHLGPEQSFVNSSLGRSQIVARGFIPRVVLRGAQGPALRRVSLVAARGYVHCHATGGVVVLRSFARSIR